MISFLLFSGAYFASVLEFTRLIELLRDLC